MNELISACVISAQIACNFILSISASYVCKGEVVEHAEPLGPKNYIEFDTCPSGQAQSSPGPRRLFAFPDAFKTMPRDKVTARDS
jgi:hypothetical protein